MLSSARKRHINLPTQHKEQQSTPRISGETFPKKHKRRKRSRGDGFPCSRCRKCSRCCGSSSSTSGGDHLPIFTSQDVRDSISNQQRTRIIKIIAMGTFVIIFFIWFIDQCIARYFLYSLPYLPFRHFHKTPSPDDAKVAIVTLHMGFKYHGYVGTFLRNSKRAYASFQRYAIFDESAYKKLKKSNKLPEVGKREMDANGRDVYYAKPKFLLAIMEAYENLEWLLWIDGDAMITRPDVTVDERVAMFTAIKQNQQRVGTSIQSDDDAPCLVWAKDVTNRPNAGVMLLHNTPVTRELFRISLRTYKDERDFRTFTDQASLTAAIQQNRTYASCSLTLSIDDTDKDARLIQSRARFQPAWNPEDWIVHFPNHNWLELQSSLKKVGKTMTQWRYPTQPTFDPIPMMVDLSSVSKQQRERYEAVQGAIKHAWSGYSENCLQSKQQTSSYFFRFFASHIPPDDYNPLTKSCHSWLYYGASLHDSLDTLYLAGLEKEYNEAVSLVLKTDIQTTSLRPTKTFEYSLRIIGGLLGAYSLSGDERLLRKAADAADALLQSPFRSSPTALPRMYDVLYPTSGRWWGISSIIYKLYARIYQWGRDVFTSEHHINSLAGVGSFALEFYALSGYLGWPRYKYAADDIYHHLLTYKQPGGAVPYLFNVMNGNPVRPSTSLGSGSDSFYEYLLKVPVWAGCLNEALPALHCTSEARLMLDNYVELVHGFIQTNNIAQKGGKYDIAYPADGKNYHQLLCFVPGMIALGSSFSSDGSDLELSKRLLRGCTEMYQKSETGLGPEEANIGAGVNKMPEITDTSYLLRPEYVESLFILYRITGEDAYQDLGWEVFDSLEKHCKIKNGGYAGLKDVNNINLGGNHNRVDDMPSYFIAETLKYLLLLFAPKDRISLDNFVFTTEAHPLRKLDKRIFVWSGGDS